MNQPIVGYGWVQDLVNFIIKKMVVVDTVCLEYKVKVIWLIDGHTNKKTK